MNEKTLKCGNAVVNKKELLLKNQVVLNLVNIDKIVVSEKFKHNGKGFKYFIGYLNDNIVRPLCIILPQMSGFKKCFDDGGKNMSFKIEDDNIFLKYNEN